MRNSLNMSTVCGGRFERGACPLFWWGGGGWRRRRGERGGRRGGRGRCRGGVGRNRASSGGAAARGATGWRVGWQGLKHTATPLLNCVLNKDKDRGELNCVVVFCCSGSVMLWWNALWPVYCAYFHPASNMYLYSCHSTLVPFVTAQTMAKSFVVLRCGRGGFGALGKLLNETMDVAITRVILMNVIRSLFFPMIFRQISGYLFTYWDTVRDTTISQCKLYCF